MARHPVRCCRAIRSACQSWSLTPSIMAYSKEMRRPVFAKYRWQAANSSSTSQARFTGMIRERVSLSGAWRDTDSVSCRSSSASRVDARHHAAGGQADMPHADVQPVGMVHQLAESAARCPDCPAARRCPSARCWRSGSPESSWVNSTWSSISAGGQVPDLAGDGGGAEGAAHAAAHLGGDADGIAVVILHQHRFDAVAVRQLPQVFDGAVQPGFLLPGHGGRGDGDTPAPAAARRGLDRLLISSKERTPRCSQVNTCLPRKAGWPMSCQHPR